MSFFSKPPIKKKPEPAEVREARPASGASRASSSRRTAGRQGRAGRSSLPGGDITVTGASLIEWAPASASSRSRRRIPGLCAVLENAALRFASGHAAEARELLEQGVETDHDTKLSPLAWLALFDLLQRAGDRAAFDQLALQYVVQFERSAPAWEEADGDSAAGAAARRRRLHRPHREADRRVGDAARGPEARHGEARSHGARLDLMSVTDFDDEGARLLAERARRSAAREVRAAAPAGAEARQRDRRRAVEEGRDAGEGAWLLSLELLQWSNDRAAFEDRAVEFAVTFELSPPSWEPPVAPGRRRRSRRSR